MRKDDFSVIAQSKGKISKWVLNPEKEKFEFGNEKKEKHEHPLNLSISVSGGKETN